MGIYSLSNSVSQASLKVASFFDVIHIKSSDEVCQLRVGLMKVFLSWDQGMIT